MKLPGSNSALIASSGSRLSTAVQPCWSTMRTSFSPRISTVPIATISDEPIITNSAAGRSNTIGSRPSTSTPAKLTATPTPVRQPKRSPSSHHASSTDIGT